MQLIKFRDTCVIERETDPKVKDEWDNPMRDTLYSGPCLYEEGGTGYSRSIITRAPTVFIPGVNAQVRINDYVTITTEFGRKISSIVKIVRDINMPWSSGEKITRIELKQAQGD